MYHPELTLGIELSMWADPAVSFTPSPYDTYGERRITYAERPRLTQFEHGTFRSHLLISALSKSGTMCTGLRAHLNFIRRHSMQLRIG